MKRGWVRLVGRRHVEKCMAGCVGHVASSIVLKLNQLSLMQVENQTRERSRETAKPIVQEVEDSMKRGWAEIKDAVKSVTDPSGEPHGLDLSHDRDS